MTRRAKIKNQYFTWICGFVSDRRVPYVNLFNHLFRREFYYIIDMDGNRAADGENLRYRFGRENGYSDTLIASFLDIEPCSVLEMMVALAIRCEDHIMDDPEFGDRTGQWFWNMIASLGLDHMTDDNYDLNYVDDVLDRFMSREHERDGRGSLFTVKNSRQDMRCLEIFYQMCAYLNTII